MKVLMVGSNNKVKGGISSVIKQLQAYEWAKEDIELKCIYTFNEGNLLYKIMYFLKAVFCVVLNFIFLKPDIMYAHMSHKGSFFRKKILTHIAHAFKVKVVIHLHSSSFIDFYDSSNETVKRWICSFLDEIDLLIVLGEKWKNRIKKIQPNTKIVVLNNTIAVPEMKNKEEKKGITFLFLGVLVERKGVHDLLSAINLLKNNNHLNDDIKFIIAGSGEKESELKKYCRINRLDGFVEFVGWTSGEKKEQLLRDSHALVLPSYNEGLPIAILEAMSYENAIIATDVGDVSSAVIENENGYLFVPGDIEALSNHLERMCKNKDLVLDMGRKSREIVKRKFDQSCYFSKIATIMRMVIRG